MSRDENGRLLLRVGWGGDFDPAPAVLRDGAAAELQVTRSSGFGLVYETVYVVDRPGRYEAVHAGAHRVDFRVRGR